MSKELITALVQVAISLGGAAGIVQILLLRANRRKITGDASASEANAASTLSGAALKMVENAQAAQGRAEAATALVQAKYDAKDEAYDRLYEESQNMQWVNMRLRARVNQLEETFRLSGQRLPSAPEIQGHPTVELPPPG